KVARGTLSAGILIALVGGAGMVWCCWRLLAPRNLLVLDVQGLTGLYFGRLLWEEVRRLYVREQHAGPVRAWYLAIEPQDLEAVIGRLGPLRRWTVRNQLAQDVPALLIGLWLLPVAVDELWLAVERFCPRVSGRQHGDGNRQQLG